MIYVSSIVENNSNLDNGKCNNIYCNFVTVCTRKEAQLRNVKTQQNVQVGCKKVCTAISVQYIISSTCSEQLK